MNRLIKETDQVIKLNLRQLVIFEVLFRLVAGTFYIRLVNQLLRFSLRMAGYSYLTMSNMGAFLLRPATIVCALAAAVLGMVLMVVEIGGLITAYQSAAYSIRNPARAGCPTGAGTAGGCSGAHRDTYHAGVLCLHD